MSKATANPFSGKPKGPKTVDHIRVHRTMEGGHRIERHHAGYEHEPEVKEFGPKDGAKAAAHLMKVTGMKAPQQSDEDGDEE